MLATALLLFTEMGTEQDKLWQTVRVRQPYHTYIGRACAFALSKTISNNHLFKIGYDVVSRLGPSGRYNLFKKKKIRAEILVGQSSQMPL